MYGAIKTLFPNADDSDFDLVDSLDGNGSRISKWNTAKLGNPPSAQDIAAAQGTAQASAAWKVRQAQAQEALNKSDTTLLRCAENAVAVPAAWTAYRKELRTVVIAATGDATQALPTKPPYPAGT